MNFDEQIVNHWMAAKYEIIHCSYHVSYSNLYPSVIVVETFPRHFRDLSTCLNFEIVRYIKIPTTEAIDSNDLNIQN